MKFRLDTNDLMTTLTAWDELLPGKGKIRLIACGGTALTLLGYKESTKDVDFLVPVKMEYRKLIGFLQAAGYEQVTGFGWRRKGENFIFDLYPGKTVYSTELLSSPLAKGRHRKMREWKKVYLGILNPEDLIISKMFRGSEVDVQDSLVLLECEKVGLRKLKKRYFETARYDTGEAKALKNWDRLLERMAHDGST